MADYRCGERFSVDPECDDCLGTGFYTPNDEPNVICVTCYENAIRAGELDGWIGVVQFVGGVPVGV